MSSRRIPVNYEIPQDDPLDPGFRDHLRQANFIKNHDDDEDEFRPPSSPQKTLDDTHADEEQNDNATTHAAEGADMYKFGWESDAGSDDSDELDAARPPKKLKAVSTKKFNFSVPRPCMHLFKKNPLANFQIQTAAYQFIAMVQSYPKFEDHFADIPEVLPFATQGEVSTAVKEELDEFWARCPCIPAFTESKSAAISRCDGRLNKKGGRAANHTAAYIKRP